MDPAALIWRWSAVGFTGGVVTGERGVEGDEGAGDLAMNVQRGVCTTSDPIRKCWIFTTIPTANKDIIYMYIYIYIYIYILSFV